MSPHSSYTEVPAPSTFKCVYGHSQQCNSVKVRPLKWMQYDPFPYKKTGGWDRDKYTQWGKTRWKPRKKAATCHPRRELREKQNETLPTPPRTSSLQNWAENELLLFKPPACGTLLWLLYWTNIPPTETLHQNFAYSARLSISWSWAAGHSPMGLKNGTPVTPRWTYPLTSAQLLPALREHHWTAPLPAPGPSFSISFPFTSPVKAAICHYLVYCLSSLTRMEAPSGQGVSSLYPQYQGKEKLFIEWVYNVRFFWIMSVGTSSICDTLTHHNLFGFFFFLLYFNSRSSGMLAEKRGTDFCKGNLSASQNLVQGVLICLKATIHAILNDGGQAR